MNKTYNTILPNPFDNIPNSLTVKVKAGIKRIKENTRKLKEKKKRKK